MQNSQKLKRHGYHLMSVASAFLLVVFVSWILNAVWAAGYPDNNSYAIVVSPFQQEWLESVRPTVPDMLLIYFPILAGAVWTLVRLRAIGKAVYTGPAISIEVADLFGKLAKAVFLLGLLTAFGPAIIADLLFASGNLSAPFAVSHFFIWLILMLILNSIAIIIGEASRIEQENRSFV